MLPPGKTEYENVYEVRFKNTRKAFFRNVNGLNIMTGDFVAVESDRGFDVGQVSLGGVLAQLQMKKRKVDPRGDRVKKIYRRATNEDLEKLRTARSREQETLVRTRKLILDLRLDMKLSEVEFQGDNTKAIFYYIADQRVDFRELIKSLANEFRIRVEMKQIGLRHESGLVGGIGSCGRELCCSTWLVDFKSVSTAAARYQNLSLNPMKISGQCGRLKCCLNFELETYLDAIKDIPEVNKIDTEMGMAFHQKTDIFKGTLWFSYAGESTWIPLTSQQVVQLQAMNKKGVKPASLRIFDEENPDRKTVKEIDFVDVVGQAVFKDEKRRKKKKKPTGGGGETRQGNPQNRQSGGPQQPRTQNRPQQQGPQQGGPQQGSPPAQGPQQPRKGPRPDNRNSGRNENRNPGQNPNPRGPRRDGPRKGPEKGPNNGPPPPPAPPAS